MVYTQKTIDVLANLMVDIELTKFFCCPKKFLVFPTNLFVKATKEFVIVFFLTNIYVRDTKILLGQWKKVCLVYFAKIVSSVDNEKIPIREVTKYFYCCNWKYITNIVKNQVICAKTLINLSQFINMLQSAKIWLNELKFCSREYLFKLQTKPLKFVWYYVPQRHLDNFNKY